MNHSEIYTINFNNIKKNLKSGITVSLISIPLSISLAVASGSTPLAGIITAIWAGLAGAVFGGSNYNIIGPTGALSGIIASYAILNGTTGLPMLTIIAGLMILAAYALKLEKYLVLIPSSVIHGFTLGVAFIIGLGQLNFALGLKNLPQHEGLFENLVESFKHISNTSIASLVIFIIFLIGLFLFKKLTPRLPGAIILAPIGILLGYLSTAHIIPIFYQTLGGKFGEISFNFFQFVHWEISTPILKAATVVALIAILETMLSAKIADGMTRTKHNERKEMFGLGIANIVSGLTGGIPATAALARTSLNVRTGASHKTSAALNAISIATISFLLLRYFTYIPLAVIAAILVFIAIQMVEKEHYFKLWHYEREGFFVSLFVAITTIIIDPIVGILLGVAISLLLFVNRLSHGQFELKINKFKEGIIGTDSGENIKELKESADVLLYSFKGKLCYINTRAHIARFETNLIKYKYVILRMREVYFIDSDGVEALDEIIDIIESRGQRAIMTSIDHSAINLLEQLSSGYKKLKAEKMIFKKTEHALAYLDIPTKENSGTAKEV